MRHEEYGRIKERGDRHGVEIEQRRVWAARAGAEGTERADAVQNGPKKNTAGWGGRGTIRDGDGDRNGTGWWEDGVRQEG